MPSISERVDKGANLLNLHFGGYDRWINQVDLSTLDMESGIRCLLGQLFGDYTHGKARLGIALKPGEEYGFAPGLSEERQLRAEWMHHIELARARLGGPPKVGDTVRVTFDKVTITSDLMTFSGNVTAPSGRVKVEVLERAKPKPKPTVGDRVKNLQTGSKGTVVKFKGGVTVDPGVAVYVQWDGDKQARRAEVKYLDVIPVDYYTSPTFNDLLSSYYYATATPKYPRFY